MAAAVELPAAHLSVRIPWNDTDWTGRVCRDPMANMSCSVLKNIKENKSGDAEAQVAGTPWPSEASEGEVPPCALERGGFMRTHALTVVRTHAYAKHTNGPTTHRHFMPTAHRMAPYSFEAVPFRWTRRQSAAEVAEQWNLEYSQELEDHIDELMPFSSGWVQDHRNQRALLDSFFSALVPERSLVFVYAKDIPLVEEREPGARFLIGVGRVTSVAPIQEWEYDGDPADWPVRSYLWERSVGHSIRPGSSDGFLLPYRELLNNPELANQDLSEFVARAPDEHWDEFSMASEHVSHDGAIAALAELARVVDLCGGVVDGPWPQVSTWLSERIGEVWGMRGPFPGLGSVLAAAGVERGALVAQRVLDVAAEAGSVDPWPVLDQAFTDAAAGGGPIHELVGRMARRGWKAVTGDPQRLALARLLARVPLTAKQARRVFDPQERTGALTAVTDADLLDNPYLVYELDRAEPDAVPLPLVDRGMFPQDAQARQVLSLYPLLDPVTEAADDRRVRAGCIEVLETAVADGSTVLDEPRLRRLLADLPLDPACDPPGTVFRIATQEFPPALVEQPLASSTGRGWQLARCADAARVITDDVRDRTAQPPLPVAIDTRAAIDAVIGGPASEGDVDEEAARREKARALDVLLGSRLGLLIGPAGTGKTKLLQALCSTDEIRSGGVLLLAPTGKARVQLGDRVGIEAKTLAQFLRPSGRWTTDYGYRLQPTKPRTANYRTVIIDEASMLTEDMLAAVLDAVTGVQRLVLAGDHRQLPPIGAGRPFVDLIEHLRSSPVNGGAGLAQLSISRRQRTTAAGGQRDDLALAAFFAPDLVSAAADETLARIVAGGGDGTVEVIPWTTEDELHACVVDWLSNDPTIGLQVHDGDALRASLGATSIHKDRPYFPFGSGGAGTENWQLLSPVRSRTGGVDGLNAMVRRVWRSGDLQTALTSWRLPPPMGADQVLFYDKVMCNTNGTRQAWLVADRRAEDCGISNGEIGAAVTWRKKKSGKPDGLKVEFSSQPGRQFTFWARDMNADSERGDVLELAYAVTIHKAQGSQFATTLVVIPNPCSLVSPELLYTALTRQRERTVLFVQGAPDDLRAFADPSRSAIAARLTCLFQPADPYAAPDGSVLDGRHIHRTAQGAMVRSKSEVIVGDTLTRLGIEYEYETPLTQPDGSSRLPDFTVRLPGRPPVYWEHLGMLDRHGYLADWTAKQAWYATHGIHPWSDGGGPNGTLAWSTENIDGPGIDSTVVETLAREVFNL